MTALTPYSIGPLAAQSLEEPEPYSPPAKMIVSYPSSIYFLAASNTDNLVFDGMCIVSGPTLSTNLLMRRTLAKVPLAITSSFPLLAP